jgi:hypothetical protein
MTFQRPQLLRITASVTAFFRTIHLLVSDQRCHPEKDRCPLRRF